ncbi:MAG: SPL family radical SAM protein [Bacillota bacterium]
MNLIPAKTIISRTPHNDGWFGYDYNMNIYKGCCHGCIYCDSRSVCYGIENFDEVKAKENALAIIERELKSKRKTGVIGTGAMGDPYNPFEVEHKLTRGALELIHKYGFGVNMLTKSPLVTRDIDLYERIAAHSPVCVKLTITTFDDDLCKKIEQNVEATSKRFEAIKELSKAGLFTGILIMPLLPFINDTEENLVSIVQVAVEAGAKFIYPAFGVTLRQNQRDYFYQQLDRLFPEMKQNYIKTFGYSYQCVSPNAKRLWQVFIPLCHKYGILYKMQDIISAYKQGYGDKQISLF